MREKPIRRWFQFSLRTMFVGVMLLSLPLGWVGYSLNSIRQRHAILTVLDSSSDNAYCTQDYHLGTRTALNGLWLFGEAGVIWLIVPESPPAEIDRTRRLFPEAELVVDDSFGVNRRYRPLDRRYEPMPNRTTLMIDGKIIEPPPALP
jgi:hypothetical protein